MKNTLVYPVGTTQACLCAADFLKNAGIKLVDHPAPEVTHLLLDIPSFGPDGLLRGGGNLEAVLERLPPNITVVGGSLHHPDLDKYRTVDLLKDAHYLAGNAAITADCALQIAAPLLATTFADSPALVIGWGRIGKCLGQVLRAIDCNVTIAARKETDRAIIQALGFAAVDMNGLAKILPKCRLIFNTVPAMILNKEVLERCKKCIKIDLASKPGMEGEDIVWARGLPGIYAPESSGHLIANTFLRLYKEAL